MEMTLRTLGEVWNGFCGQSRGDLGSRGDCRQGCETGALAALGAWDKRVPEGMDDGAAFGA